jgi:60 kDa SS-A/Ro ribonucleoprotein
VRLNVPITHEGARAAFISDYDALRRSVMSCMLWENEFYEDGVEIGKRITDLAFKVKVSELASLAVEAREVGKLRHAPLLLLSVLAERGRGSGVVGDTIARVIGRIDECGELIAVHARRHGKSARDVKGILSAQMKKGIGRALAKFDEYQVGKYVNRPGAVSLADVIMLCHPKPVNDDQVKLWRRVLDLQYNADTVKFEADTWERALSGGGDKKETFERMIREGTLGYLALLRNLRNMHEAGVSHALVEDAIWKRRGAAKVLPFRYVAAMLAAPVWKNVLEEAMRASIGDDWPGLTAVLIDVSGSMEAKLSGKGEMTRLDAAAALGVMVPGGKEVFTFSNYLVKVDSDSVSIDGIKSSQSHSGTRLGLAVQAIVNSITYDRLIVITDEQSHDEVPDTRGYMINVASARNGVGYGEGWVHIDGFSENVLRWIEDHERTSPLVSFSKSS